MALTRKEQLEFCKICENRSFSQKEGIICQLTNTKANFTELCDNYSADSDEIKKLNQRHNFKNRINDITFGLDNLGLNNGFKAGFLLIGISLILFVLFILTERLSIYALVLFLMGLTSIISASINKIRRKAKGPLIGHDNTVSKDIIDNTPI